MSANKARKIGPLNARLSTDMLSRIVAVIAAAVRQLGLTVTQDIPLGPDQMRSNYLDVPTEKEAQALLAHNQKNRKG